MTALNLTALNRSRRPLRSVALLLPALWLIGCSDSLTAPEESLALDADAAFFLAETSVSMDASPQARAGVAVAHARDILVRATAAIGARPGVSAEVLALIAEAGSACVRADEHLASGAFRASVAAAMSCANLAREAVLRAGAERRTELRDRASAAVASAQALVSAAAAKVQSDSPEQAKVVLARAQSELALAVAALEAGRLGEAVGRAARAGAMAQRILSVLG